MNQIGGIGAVGSGNRSRAFATTADGVNKSQCKSGKHVFKPWIGTCAACSPGCDTNQCLKFSVTTEANQLQGPFKYINNCGELVESELQDIINQNTHIMNNVKCQPCEGTDYMIHVYHKSKLSTDGLIRKYAFFYKICS